MALDNSMAVSSRRAIIGTNDGLYRQLSNIRRTKSQYLKDFRTVLRLSLPKPDVKSRMKI